MTGLRRSGTGRRMALLLTAILPFFAVIGLGVLAARRGWVPSSAAAPLNGFVFKVAMPALLIRALWAMDVRAALEPRYLGGWLAASLILYAGAALLMRAGFGAGDGPGRSAVRAQGSSIGNIGFLGIPLGLGVMGEAAAGPLAMSLLVDLMVVIPVSIAWLEGARPGPDARVSRRRALAARALGRSIKNPFFLSILVGAGLSASGLAIPEPVDRLLTFLGAAAPPTALFSLGLYLAANAGVARLAEASSVTLLKLAAHPALVWAIMGPGLGLSGPPLAAAVLIASLPVASNVFVIAAEYGVGAKLAADAVTLSTALSLATISALAIWVLPTL
ncbi:MAG: AEC family transporter [Rhodobacteraceae bacterium]|nr:MAG: AEC family transporter [Paracoccaceae bacterium]